MRDRITAAGTALLPRCIRARDAHGYCGMCRAVFNQTLRPYLTEDGQELLTCCFNKILSGAGCN